MAKVVDQKQTIQNTIKVVDFMNTIDSIFAAIQQHPWTHIVAIVLGSIIAALWRTISKYSDKKFENLAINEDITELTKKVKLVEEEFNNKLEEVKEKHTKEIARYNALLDQAKHISRVQFEKEFQIYEVLWKSLVKLRYTINCIEQERDGMGFPVTSEEREQRNQNFIEAANAFYFTIEENMPFYEREIYNELTKISQIGAMKIVKVTDPSNHPPTTNIEKAKFVNDVINSKKNLLEVTNNIAYKIRDRIENIKVIDSV